MLVQSGAPAKLLETKEDGPMEGSSGADASAGAPQCRQGEALPVITGLFSPTIRRANRYSAVRSASTGLAAFFAR